MKKYFIIFTLIFSTSFIFAQPKFTEINSMPGAFSRMGFGARGMGMGNAMSAVINGNLVSYYNPALSVFQGSNSFQTSYSVLSLDRSLNFLSFTRNFKFKSLKSKRTYSSAGVSAGIINSGVGKIDEYDNNDINLGSFSTSENQFFFGLANRFSEKFAIGIEVKFYYYKLYQNIKANGIGFDLGGIYMINDEWTMSAVISDLNSKYKWDSTPIYNQDGMQTEDNFPNLRKIGLSYRNKNLNLLTAIEFENSNAGTNIIRLGLEYNVIENLYLRGGIDQFNLSNTDSPARPSLGFSYAKSFDGIMIGVDYAFVIEQYSPQDRHIVGININF